ncbi:hypothetical protein [Streptomyces atratus]
MTRLENRPNTALLVVIAVAQRPVGRGRRAAPVVSVGRSCLR